MPLAPIVVYQTHPTIPAGHVISQDPPYTSEHSDPNTVVTLYVSSGPFLRWTLAPAAAGIWTLQ